MDTVLSILTDNDASETISSRRTETISREHDYAALSFDLGLWLSGLESFLTFSNSYYGEEHLSRSASRDWTKEFRLTHSALLLCSSLTFQLARRLREQNAKADDSENRSILPGTLFETEPTEKELFELSMALREGILLGEGFLRAAPLRFGEWTAWSSSLLAKMQSAAAFAKLIRSAEKTGEDFLPDVIKTLLENAPAPAAVKADLAEVFPRIGKILKWLGVIENMVREDKPLKSALLIFARVFRQIRELTEYLNNRLRRFPDQESELYGALDGAAYVASIELRKVYQYELTGVADIRPTPQARARIEASQGLLSDSFQQTLISFARLLDPHLKTEEVFPAFHDKLRQSVRLRRDLFDLMEEVRKAEKTPDVYPIDELNEKLSGFVRTSMRFLMYKDWETFERFVEEVARTAGRKDLAPLLHRFGAYLETLFGQVQMRSVLADHPFDISQS